MAAARTDAYFLAARWRNRVPGELCKVKKPQVLVVMGVSGSGKSTIAAQLAERLGWIFADGDDFHSAAHRAKMQAGQPLDDADRAPWLAAIGDWIAARSRAGEGAVVACSALKRRYRDSLSSGRSGVRLVYLDGSPSLIAGRLAHRQGHFMPAALLDSQFAALEPPGPDEHPITVAIGETPDAIADRIIAQLETEEAVS